jgi:hypothetical protein
MVTTATTAGPTYAMMTDDVRYFLALVSYYLKARQSEEFGTEARRCTRYNQPSEQLLSVDADSLGLGSSQSQLRTATQSKCRSLTADDRYVWTLRHSGIPPAGQEASTAEYGDW